MEAKKYVRPHEVRLGNYVWNPVQECVVEVTMPVFVSIYTDERLGRKEADRFQAVPATEDMIEALHFTILNEDDYIENGVYFYKAKRFYYVLDSIEDDYGNWQYSEVPFDYIHELQNIHYDCTGRQLKFNK